MPFIEKRSGTYMAVDNQPRVIRPLATKPIPKWCYNISNVSSISPDGKKKQVLRTFKQIDQDNPFASIIKNAIDPLWDLLEMKQKFNRKGDRQDFPSRPVLILPVFSYADNDVKIIKQGSQLFEEMEKYFDAGQNIMSCDWTIWQEKTANQTNYKSTRHDSTPFGVPNTELLMVKAKELVERSLSDLFPFKTQDEFVKYISGKAGDAEASNFNQGGPVPSAPQSYTPTSGSPVALGQFNPPMSPMAPAAPAMAPFMPAPVGFTPPTVPAMPGPATFAAPGVPNPFAPSMPVAQPQQPMQFQQPAFQPQPVGFPQPTGFSQTGAPPFNQTMMAPSPFAPTGFQTPNLAMPQAAEVPAAPVQAQTFFPPPAMPASMGGPTPQVPVAQAPVPQMQVQQVSGDSSQIVIPSGKHQGKTLGQVLLGDGGVKYLQFLKGHIREFAGPIDQLLASHGQNGQSAMPTPAQPAPSNGGMQITGGAEMQAALAQEVTNLLMKVPEFQGDGVVPRMMPFISQIIGDTNYSQAPVDRLMHLRMALQQKLGVSAVA